MSNLIGLLAVNQLYVNGEILFHGHKFFRIRIQYIYVCVCVCVWVGGCVGWVCGGGCGGGCTFLMINSTITYIKLCAYRKH